ncbi:LytR/AlgR family response regulator transcription factor [Planctomycetota bacterium]
MNEHRRIRAIIVDDEPLGREAVRRLVAQASDFVVIAECAGGEEALREIPSQNPDVVFLDIQMPRCDGFDVVTRLDQSMPPTVFVTAYDEYAIRAFDVYALDYVLKPVEPVRFQKTLERVRSHSGDSKVTGLLDEIHGRTIVPSRLVFKTSTRLLILSPNELLWVESAGNYVRLHTADGQHLVREGIGKLAARLDRPQFIRVHRSAIVNVAVVRGLRQDDSSSDPDLHLIDGSVIPVGRSFRTDVARALQGIVGPS